MTNSNKTKVYEQHYEASEWMNKLFFYEDELAIMQRRLQEIAAANTAQEVLAQVEHFQNQLIVQRDNIDAIKHAVAKDETRLEKNISSNPVAADHRTADYHEREKNEVDLFEKNFNALRDELKKFLLKYL
jgi:hypothetical protein